jgi:hypothetical protein
MDFRKEMFPHYQFVKNFVLMNTTSGRTKFDERAKEFSSGSFREMRHDFHNVKNHQNITLFG